MDAEAQIMAELTALRNAIEGLDSKVSSLEYLALARSEASKAKSPEEGNPPQRQISETEAIGYVATSGESKESWPESTVCCEDWSTLAGKDIAGLIQEGRKGEKLLAELIRVYSDFPEVQAIAVGPYLEEIRVFVITRATEHYDYELTGRLIEEENKLLDRFEPLCLSMSYPAVRESESQKLTYSGGSIVWRRGSKESE